MGKGLLAILVALIGCSGSPAFAQEPEAASADAVVFDRACMDDYGRNLCDRGIWSDIVANFGLEPAELVQGRGMRGVRVFTVDGYSNDMPAITILTRTPGDDGGKPNLNVYWERFNDSGTARHASLSRTGSPVHWRLATNLQALVAASPERQPEEAAADGQVSICLHAWVTVTESLTDTGVTRRIRNACGEDSLFDKAYGMSAEMLRAFPDCGLVDRANHRNESVTLQRCFALDGIDKTAAAQVLNLMDRDISDVRDLAPWLSPGVRMTLPDHIAVAGSAEVAESLADPDLSDRRLHATRVAGEAGRVAASGYIEEYLDDGVEAATVQLVWRRSGTDWRIEMIAVGPFQVIN